MTMSREQVEQALKTYIDPYLKQDLVTAKVIRRLEVQGNTVVMDIVFGFPISGYQDKLVTTLRDCLRQIGIIDSRINVSFSVVSHAVQKGVKPLKNVKNIIAVASGKGGVGKSTTAVNLALALAAEGGQVGILDADIYGPSQPRMLGSATQRPQSADGKSMEPINSHGIQSISIGYLIDEESPMIWRGPMVTQALEQLLRDTNWKELDYLVIDLPPGTGDIQLTLAQRVPVSGAIIITTPQDIALLDARKGLKMFQKVDVPVLGVIENMSTHICGNCGHEEHIFGSGGGKQMAEQFGIDLLGQLPLDIRIREDADGGKPSVIADPEGKIAHIYRDIARKVAAALSLRAKDYTSKFPNIIIQET